MKRKRTAVRRRPVKKMRIMRPRRMRMLKPVTLHVKRIKYQETWTFNTVGTSGFWRYYTWTTGNFNNFGEFSNIFDEYRVNALKYTFRPRYDSYARVDGIAPGATGGGMNGQIFVVVDPASTTIPTGVFGAGTLQTLLEQSGVRTYPAHKPISVYFKPKVADSLQGGGTSTRLVRPTFIKTDNTGVDHRGFHIYLQPNAYTTSADWQLDVFITAYVTFRNLR